MRTKTTLWNGEQDGENEVTYVTVYFLCTHHIILSQSLDSLHETRIGREDAEDEEE